MADQEESRLFSPIFIGRNIGRYEPVDETVKPSYHTCNERHHLDDRFRQFSIGTQQIVPLWCAPIAELLNCSKTGDLD